MNPTKLKLRLTVTTLALSAAGAIVISGFEDGPNGPSQTAYLDIVGIPTICTGSTRNVFLGQHATLKECEERLVQDTTYAGAAIKKHVKVKLTQKQYDTLVSFVFNVGGGAFSRSTMLRYINANECRLAGKEFLRWDRAGGKRLKGLTKRRGIESAAWLEDCDVWNWY